MLGKHWCNAKKTEFSYLDSPKLWYIWRLQMSSPVRLQLVVFGLEAAAPATDGVLDLGFLKLQR